MRGSRPLWGKDSDTWRALAAFCRAASGKQGLRHGLDGTWAKNGHCRSGKRRQLSSANEIQVIYDKRFATKPAIAAPFSDVTCSSPRNCVGHLPLGLRGD